MVSIGSQHHERDAARLTGIKPDRLTLTVEEAAGLLGVGRTLAFELARRGEIPTIRLGRRLVVPRAALERLLDSTSDRPIRDSLDTPCR